MSPAPLFVKLENYDEVINTMETIKTKIEAAKALLDEIADLKAEEDEHISKWKEQLDIAEDRVNEIDKTLAEPETI
jgi:uncharacterized coiled-coil DUF342 family protein